MTIIMTFFGIFVFIFSCFSVGFKSAVKRLLVMAGIGALVDITLAFIAYGITVGF